MALIKKQLLAKEDMLLSADNTPVSQARAGTTVSVHPVNASVIPYDGKRSIAEAIQGVTYTHPLTHPVSIIDGSSNPSKFVKTDALGNTGFDGVAWADIEGKPGTYTPSAHEHSMVEVAAGTLSATRVDITADRQFITADQATQLLDMEVKSNKGIPNGYAPLDSNGKINSSFLSSLNLVEVFTPVDLASMLALTSAQPGDIAYRQDNSTTYMLVALPSSTEANWKSLNIGSQVISVNGKTGIVSLNTSDIAEATNLYFTNERVDNRVAALLQAGTNITLAYNDTLNTLTINANDTSVNWSEIQSKPTTISGYGITDAYTKTESNAALSLKADDSTVVHKTGGETIAGVKTFTSSPIVPTATTSTQAVNKGQLDLKANDSAVVHKTGDETIAEVKTFSSSPIVPNATTATQAMAYGQGVNLTAAQTIAGVKTFSDNTIFNNNVGIGTNSPTARLHSNVGVGDALALNGGSCKGLSVFSTNTSASVDGGLKIKQISNGSIVSALELQGLDTGSGIIFYAGGNIERMRIDTSGNVLVIGSGGLGYGTGAGGTVTQLTSKSTAVTLNKPSGKITMNNASLAAGAAVSFLFLNNSIYTTDTVTVNTVAGTYGALNSYDVKAEAVASSFCYITVKNNTGVPLSDALQIQFNVHKGSIN